MTGAYDSTLKPHLQAELAAIRDGGLWKEERVLASAQGPEVTLADGRRVLVLCANNYLGLSSDPRVIAAATLAPSSQGAPTTSKGMSVPRPTDTLVASRSATAG